MRPSVRVKDCEWLISGVAHMKNPSNHTIEAKRSLCCLLLWVFEWVSEWVSEWVGVHYFVSLSSLTHSFNHVSSQFHQWWVRCVLGHFFCASHQSCYWSGERQRWVSEWVSEGGREGGAECVCVWVNVWGREWMIVCVSEWVPLWSIRCHKPLHHSTLISSPSLRYSSTSITWPHSCHVMSLCVCVCVVPCSTSGDVDAAVQAGRK